MDFLDIRPVLARNRDDMIGRSGFHSIPAAKGDCHCALLLCGLQTPEDIRGFSAGSYPNRYIAHRCEAFDLTLEERIVSKIIGDARHHAGVGDKRYSWKRSPRILESTDKLLDQVTRLCRAPAVPKGEKLPAAGEAGDDRLTRRIRSRLKRSDALGDNLLVLAEMRGEMLGGHAPDYIGD